MRFKRMLLVIAGVGMFFSNGIFVTAREPESDERVIEVAIPDENGELRYYTGEEAQKRYDQLEKSRTRIRRMRLYWMMRESNGISRKTLMYLCVGVELEMLISVVRFFC